MRRNKSPCRQLATAMEMIRYLVIVCVLFSEVPSVPAVAATGDSPAASRQNNLADLPASELPGVAVAGETVLIESIYAHSRSTPLWSRAGQLSEQARALIKILNTAESLGLRPGDYGTDTLTMAAGQLNGRSSAAEFVRIDQWFTRAAVRLISHLHYGRVNPHDAGFEIADSREDLDVAAAVEALAVAANVSDAVAGAEPPFYHYALLKSALSRYRNLATDANLTKLPGIGTRSIHLGEFYAGAAELRQLLIAEGDLPEQAGERTAADQTLDAALVEALRRFQDRHGLAVDGALGASTYATLTTPMAQRVRQIELTLERWRWLPAFDSPPIIVNIPEFRLFAFNTTADRVASILQMPVIVGQTYPGKRTPVFVGDLRFVIFRPYWDIPRSITMHEMLPQIRADPNYLQRNGLEIVRGDGDDAAIMDPTPETIEAMAAGRFRLRQRPGEDNALGLIKFMFPNAHNVYLHSTPAHQLFLASRRAFSHGCIRVNDPAALATYVLRNAADPWNNERIDAAMHGARSLRVELRIPIHVMILYGTAMATEAGPVQFFDDIYGHDRKLEILLGLKPVS
jgi:murein L,D-transpeptidase YcbB/YkuD